ncbi:MAG TPA: PEP-CTERM sorting domain-containing protein, partial [Myxococcota bacterium]|nr:PEP-CTERM sorting domain-containing protein [Myxococcota bacterium]
FRWTSGGGMTGLGDLAGGIFFSSAVDVSSDGSVVVGYGRLATQNQAFRWTSGGGMVGLEGFLNSGASAVSADGSVIVGTGTSALGIEAFRWTAEGGMVGLGQLPNGFSYSTATDVSADGSLVVGAAGPSAGGPAFIWDGTHGMRSLQTVLVTDYHLNLTGWNLGEATAISSDGTTIVGNGIHAGHSEGWIAVIPEPSTRLLFGAGLVVLAVRRRDA